MAKDKSDVFNSEVNEKDAEERENRVKSAREKIRVVDLYKIFRDHSNEKEPLGVNEIISWFADSNLRCRRATLYKDLDNFEAAEYVVRTCKGRKYYFNQEERQINSAQARFLADLLQSAAFLTKSMTNELIANVSLLLGDNEANQLQTDIIRFDTTKHNNKTIFSSLVEIDNAIAENKKISFSYSQLKFGDENTLVDRTCNPISLIFNNGYYYVCCCYDGSERIYPYRLDRMFNVKAEESDATIGKEAYKKLQDDKLKQFLASFGMWIGDIKAITLRMKNKHLGDIVDKFGDVKRIEDSEKDGWFRTTIYAYPSEPFWGWCASYGDELEIISPENVKKRFVEQVKKALSVYN